MCVDIVVSICLFIIFFWTSRFRHWMYIDVLKYQFKTTGNTNEVFIFWVVRTDNQKLTHDNALSHEIDITLQSSIWSRTVIFLQENLSRSRCIVKNVIILSFQFRKLLMIKKNFSSVHPIFITYMWSECTRILLIFMIQVKMIYSRRGDMIYSFQLNRRSSRYKNKWMMYYDYRRVNEYNMIETMRGILRLTSVSYSWLSWWIRSLFYRS